MPHTPDVSIICPSYNHAAFLPAAIAGVQAQTFVDWELLLIDDGSQDESVAIARELASHDRRIRVHVNEQNLGTYGTQERGRAIASGEYLAILNSDDVWEPNKLALQLELFRRFPGSEVCYTLGWKIDEMGNVDHEDDVHFDWPMEEQQDLLPYLLYENRVLASSVLFRKGAMKFDPTLRYSGDWVALLAPARRHPILCMPERLNDWRMHGNNTFVRSPNQVREEIRVREAIRAAESEWYASASSSAAVRDGLGKNALNLSALEVLRGDTSAAKRYAIEAMRRMRRPHIALRRWLSVSLPGARERLWPNDKTTFDLPDPSPKPPLQLF